MAHRPGRRRRSAYNGPYKGARSTMDTTSQDDYDTSTEGTRASREYGWSIGFGLQRTDGLTPSRYATDVARRHVRGDITYQQAARQIHDYHADNPDQRDHEEADIVAQRISRILAVPTFAFSPDALKEIHRRLFTGILPDEWTGAWRTQTITKHEPVLLGKSVMYSDPAMIAPTLTYDFNQERLRQHDYDRMDDRNVADGVFAFISGIWQIHPFREGNTRTTAVFAIQYLRFLGFDVDNKPFADRAEYFRDALALRNASIRRLRSAAALDAFEDALLFHPDRELPDLRKTDATHHEFTDDDPADPFDGLAYIGRH